MKEFILPSWKYFRRLLRIFKQLVKTLEREYREKCLALKVDGGNLEKTIQLAGFNFLICGNNKDNDDGNGYHNLITFHLLVLGIM